MSPYSWENYLNVLEAKITQLSSSPLVNGLSSVSYTHLRAHETVLDLVCRLLLEKKKNNINNSE